MLREARVARLWRLAGLISGAAGTAAGWLTVGVVPTPVRPRCCCRSNWCWTLDSAFEAGAGATGVAAAPEDACSCCRSWRDVVAGAIVDAGLSLCGKANSIDSGFP